MTADKSAGKPEFYSIRLGLKAKSTQFLLAVLNVDIWIWVLKMENAVCRVVKSLQFKTELQYLTVIDNQEFHLSFKNENKNPTHSILSFFWIWAVKV